MWEKQNESGEGIKGLTANKKKVKSADITLYTPNQKTIQNADK
jgi:hypothetical protein